MLDVSYYMRLLIHEGRVHWKAVFFTVILFVLIILKIHWWLLEDAAAVYKVVFDAGSTGTRVHVFKFSSLPKVSSLRIEKNADISEDDIQLISIPLFTKVKGGISEYAANPMGARPGLEELIFMAKDAIPRSKWEETETIFLATAGLRLLPASQAHALLAEVSTVLGNSGLKVGRVDTIDGRLEAKLMYIMTHFVTNPPTEKVQMAIVDLGGGSVQLAYRAKAVDLNSLLASSKEVGEFLEKSWNNRSVLYLHSWLGYGLVAFRMKVLEAAGPGPHPCVPDWTPAGTQYKYGDVIVDVVAGLTSIDSCISLVKTALNNKDDGQCKVLVKKEFTKSPNQCGLNGTWLGPSEPRSIPEWRLFSYIFDLAQEEGMAEKGASEAFLSAQDFMKSANKHCRKGLGDPERSKWWKCVDLIYVSVLLTEGFKLDPDFPLRVTKHLTYRGKIELEAAWPLGAAVASLRNEL
jgi:apyrase